ncbi:MAG TPA: DotU family type IV/VI secretion system protein [Thermodesulfobacteriaceae bacterium]|nr:DotU family type IV/VI secretion system protein [Thermodesulfobacteriaceae bacterium]
MRSNPLVDAYSNLFAYLCHLRETLYASPPQGEEVRNRIENLLAAGDQAARSSGIASTDIHQAFFALCALIDEFLMNESWPGQDIWKRNLLQTQYFQTTNAGEEFFSSLSALRPEQKWVREIFYLCLCLGFRGRYCKPGDEAVIARLKEAELSALKTPGEPVLQDRSPLFPQGYPSDDEAASLLLGRTSTFDRSQIILALLPPGLFLILFLVYTFVLKGMFDDILGPILGSGG